MRKLPSTVQQHGNACRILLVCGGVLGTFLCLACPRGFLQTNILLQISRSYCHNIKACGINNRTRMDPPKSESFCSDSLLRHQMEAGGHFPSGGNWKGAHFQPSACTFHPPRFLSGYFARCAREAGLTSIVTFGDSQGNRYFTALLGYFQSMAAGCRRIRVEKMENGGNRPGREYFSRGNMSWYAVFTVTSRGCRSCVSQQWSCCLDRASNDCVILEHIAMAHMWDQSLAVKNSSPLKSHLDFQSFQEFVVRFYLPSIEPPPQLLLIFPPLNHDKKKSAAALSEDFRKMKKVLLSRPFASKVYVTSGTRECDEKKARGYKNVTYDGLSATDKIHSLGSVIYKVMQGAFLDRDSGLLGFIDMLDMSSTRCTWNTDGIHFKPHWYRAVVSYIMQLYCRERRQCSNFVKCRYETRQGQYRVALGNIKPYFYENYKDRAGAKTLKL